MSCAPANIETWLRACMYVRHTHERRHHAYYKVVLR